MIQIGNTNGLIDTIYYYLWYKDESIKAGIFNVRIPDTVIYKYGKPQMWYLTSSLGEVLLKKDDSKSNENIFKTFCRGH